MRRHTMLDAFDGDMRAGSQVNLPASPDTEAGSLVWDNPNGTLHPTALSLLHDSAAPSNSGAHQAAVGDEVTSLVVNTSSTRLMLLRRRSQGTVRWSAPEPGMAMIVVRTWTKEARIAISGGPIEHIASGCTKFWFFPDGAGARGELYGTGPFDCASIFVDPSVVPSTVEASFRQPISGLVHDRLQLRFEMLGSDLIPALVDQNPWAQFRKPTDMIVEGCAMSLFHASQQ